MSAPFQMCVESAITASATSIVVTGRFVQGDAAPVGQLELVGFGPTRAVTCLGPGPSRSPSSPSQTAVLQGYNHREVALGTVLATPGLIRPYTRIEARVYILTPSEGGHRLPLHTGARPLFQFYGLVDLPGLIDLHGGLLKTNHGDTVNMSVTLTDAVGLSVGQEVVIREANSTIGIGKITALVG